MAKRTIILGTGGLALKLAAKLSTRRHYRLIGVIGEGQYAAGGGFPCPYLGRISDLRAIITECRVEKVILALEEESERLPADLLIETQASRRLAIETGTEILEKLTGKLAIESLPKSSILFSNRFRPERWSSALCRTISLVIAAMGFIISLPLMAAIALAVRVDSSGPALFIQERIGRGGKRFKLLKFRSMFHDSGRRSEWALDNDKDITRAGRLIRKFRLDELPQFINVIRGDMNIVGPRPHPVSNRELFTLVARNTPDCGEQIPYYSFRHSIRPGITGWAQVRYKYANDLEEEIEKLQYDLYYIRHYSPFLDIRILFATIKIVLFGHERQETPSLPVRAAFLATDKEVSVVSSPLVPLISHRVNDGIITIYNHSGDKISRLRGTRAGQSR